MGLSKNLHFVNVQWGSYRSHYYILGIIHTIVNCWPLMHAETKSRKPVLIGGCRPKMCIYVLIGLRWCRRKHARTLAQNRLQPHHSGMCVCVFGFELGRVACGFKNYRMREYTIIIIYYFIWYFTVQIPHWKLFMVEHSLNLEFLYNTLDWQTNMSEYICSCKCSMHVVEAVTFIV